MTIKQLNFLDEELTVDWITLKLQNSSEIYKIAEYLRDFGFNTFFLYGHLVNPKPKAIYYTSKNKFQATIRYNNYSKEIMSLIFSGKHAKHFYALSKKNIINWTIFDNPILSRFDLYYSLHQSGLQSKQTLK